MSENASNKAKYSHRTHGQVLIYILGFVLHLHTHLCMFPDNLTGFNAVADGVRKCVPYQLYVYMPF
jgi:hypothetical protein